METREFIHVVVTRHNGTKFNNDLKLSEVNILSQLLKENAEVTASRQTCSDRAYIIMFGK